MILADLDPLYDFIAELEDSPEDYPYPRRVAVKLRILLSELQKKLHDPDVDHA